jgi:hypothetical protein
MKQIIHNFLLFILPLLAGVVLLFQLQPDKKFSYHFVKGECEDKASWIYHRIFEEEESIEIAFTGASQTGCAIMDEYLEQELLKSSGQKIKVANLGYCRRGRDIQYVMVKDLFKHKKPKILVIEVAEDEPKKSHPVFPYLAETRDLRESCVFFNQRYPVNIWKGIVVRFEYLKSCLFQDGSSDPAPDIQKYGYRPSDQIAEPEILKQNETSWKNRLATSKPDFVRNIELSFSKHYLEKMVKLARQNNCEVLFLYLPESGSKMKSPLLTSYYKTLGKLFLLPDSLITNRLNWKDATHFNDAGASKATALIVSELSAAKTAPNL